MNSNQILTLVIAILGLVGGSGGLALHLGLRPSVTNALNVASQAATAAQGALQASVSHAISVPHPGVNASLPLPPSGPMAVSVSPEQLAQIQAILGTTPAPSPAGYKTP